MTLGRITIAAGRGARAEARLCGPEADPRPLAVAPRAPTSASEKPIAPVLAVRRETDDLCIRFWTP